MNKYRIFNRIGFRIGSGLKNLISLAKSNPANLTRLQWRHLGLRLKQALPQSGATVKLPYVHDLRDINQSAFNEPDISRLFPPMEADLPPTHSLRLASILDEFSDFGFRYEANLIRVTPHQWQEQIIEGKPDLVLIESAWRGNLGLWRKKIGRCTTVPDNPLGKLFEFCRSRDIPTVFWNKEDPPNFEHFKDAARFADYVFTSDSDCIPRYTKLLGHNRIAALPFAAQPRIHNPIGKRDHHLLEACFAGTWYSHKYSNRQELLRSLLAAATHRHLHIFDRRAQAFNPTYRFPKQFSRFIHDALPYPQMLRAYRDFRLFLNVNSVTDSPTMFARRVLEILACQTNVISTPSLGLKQMLGDAIVITDDVKEITAAVDTLLDGEYERRRRAHLAWRKIIREHTYTHRIDTITSMVGIGLSLGRNLHPPITLVLRHHPDGNLIKMVENVRKQSYNNIEILILPYPGIESHTQLSSLLHNRRTNRVLQPSNGEQDMATWLCQLAEVATGEFITLFDSRDVHGSELIWDLVSAFSCCDCDFITKTGHYSAMGVSRRIRLDDPEQIYRYQKTASIRIFMARLERMRSYRTWRTISEKTLAPKESLDQDLFALAVDPFGYIRNGLTNRPLETRDAADSISSEAALV